MLSRRCDRARSSWLESASSAAVSAVRWVVSLISSMLQLMSLTTVDCSSVAVATWVFISEISEIRSAMDTSAADASSAEETHQTLADGFVASRQPHYLLPLVSD